MAFITGDLSIDEAEINTGSNQDDVDYATWAAANPALAAHLDSLNLANGSGFPQVAEKDDLIDFSTASGLALSVIRRHSPISTGTRLLSPPTRPILISSWERRRMARCPSPSFLTSWTTESP